MLLSIIDLSQPEDSIMHDIAIGYTNVFSYIHFGSTVVKYMYIFHAFRKAGS